MKLCNEATSALRHKMTKRVGPNDTVTYNAEHNVSTWRYHATNIVVFDHYSKTMTLNTGGWETVTTKARLNEALGMFIGKRPGWITQKNFVWRFNGEPITFPCQVNLR